MYIRTREGLGQPLGTGECSRWEKSPENFSQAIAEHYVSTELKQQLKGERVQCRPDSKVCEVTFPGAITVGVSLVKVPEYVIARPPGEAKARREYNYSCTPQGGLTLERRWYIARIILIDPTGVFKKKDKLRKEFCAKLQDKFNKMNPRWLNLQSFRFRVGYRSGAPTREEKANFGTLDFPVYLLDTQHGPKTVRDLMKQHKVPKTIKIPTSGKEADPYKLAEDGWKSRDTRGVGIPSGEGHAKVAFIKTHRVFADATADLAQAFVNVTAHEIGHMGNLVRHSASGVMRYPVLLNVDIDFSPGDEGPFLADLRRLRFLRQ